jgi:trehalose-6-phosphatase
MATQYNSVRSLLFFLEDGALFGESRGSMPLEALRAVKALAANPSNIIYITSRRSRVDMQHIIAALPSNIGFIVECGSLIRAVSSADFLLYRDKKSHVWLNGIWHLFRSYRDRVEGSFIEQRDFSMVFHYYGSSDYPAAVRLADDLAFQAMALRGSESYKIIHKNFAVHAEPDMNIWMDWAAEYVLSQLPPSVNPEFVFVVGGVCGTNALFRWANGKDQKLDLSPRLESLQTHSGPFSFVFSLGMGLYAEEAKHKLPSRICIRDQPPRVMSLLGILDFLVRGSRLPIHPQ